MTEHKELPFAYSLQEAAKVLVYTPEGDEPTPPDYYIRASEGYAPEEVTRTFVQSLVKQTIRMRSADRAKALIGGELRHNTQALLVVMATNPGLLVRLGLNTDETRQGLIKWSTIHLTSMRNEIERRREGETPTFDTPQDVLMARARRFVDFSKKLTARNSGMGPTCERR